MYGDLDHQQRKHEPTPLHGFSRVGLVGTDGRRCEGSTAMPWSGGIAERLVNDGFGEGG